MIGVASNIFWQLGLIVIIAAIAAYLLRLIKQPQILAYVLVGILITPVFKIITDTSITQSISTIGIAFLLFIVGLEMDIKALRSVALVSALGGAIQIFLLFGTCFLLALFLGFLPLEAAYLGLLFSFSSTMIVMKLLSDKRELNTLHGRIVVGILLLEDILAILALSILSSINSFSPSIFVFALLKFICLFLLAYLASKYLFPRIFKFSAQHQELLLVTSLAVCFFFSLTFEYLKFSPAIGAFVAGISLGNLEYRTEIAGKVKSLRDFFALLFFVSLGMGLSLETIKFIWKPLLVFLAVILLFKPFLTMLICSIFKFTKRPSFLTAISLAQVGEFSLIIAAQGLALGHLSQNTFSLVVLIAIITITLTSYFIKYDNKLYTFLQHPLKLFDIFTTEGLEYLPSQARPKIILCGHNRIGYSLLKNFEPVKKKVLVIDYNPEVISMLVKKSYHCLYGDVADEEIIERMNLKNINMLISTVPDVHDNFLLIRKVREVNKRATIIVTASEIDEALRLYSHGASYVIMPHFLGGEHIAKMIINLKEKKIKIKQEKQKHIAELKERKEIGHEHPSEWQ
ncbi:cation:proton antiporter [Candidatus Woesearchaeota archaeon]|nr:cation:proton antiporter [Candidatus Woesearchaeota archaeon]